MDLSLAFYTQKQQWKLVLQAIMFHSSKLQIVEYVGRFQTAQLQA